MNIVFARKNLFSKMPQNGEVSLSRLDVPKSHQQIAVSTYYTLTYIDVHLAEDGLIVKEASRG